MTTRERPGDLGTAEARRLTREAGTELREARLMLGVSQRAVARSAGISASQLGRIERGEIRAPTLEQLCRAGRAVGIAATVRFVPAGSPVRDAGQLALLARFEALLGPPLRVHREAGLPMHGDLRAWDGMVVGGAEVFFEEGESRLRDIQAIARRIALKLRDDPRGRVVVLVVARTAHNRRVLAEHREDLRLQFPLDGAAIARAVRRGEVPTASGIIVV